PCNVRSASMHSQSRAGPPNLARRPIKDALYGHWRHGPSKLAGDHRAYLSVAGAPAEQLGHARQRSLLGGIWYQPPVHRVEAKWRPAAFAAPAAAPTFSVEPT